MHGKTCMERKCTLTTGKMWILSLFVRTNLFFIERSAFTNAWFSEHAASSVLVQFPLWAIVLSMATHWWFQICMHLAFAENSVATSGKIGWQEVVDNLQQ